MNDYCISSIYLSLVYVVSAYNIVCTPLKQLITLMARVLVLTAPTNAFLIYSGSLCKVSVDNGAVTSRFLEVALFSINLNHAYCTPTDRIIEHVVEMHA